MADVKIEGKCDEKFAAVREAFENNFKSGADVGASFAASKDGEIVVDLWGGWADEERTRPWTKDTIVNVYSTTKTMTALTALLLADRGVLDLHAPVAKYWPEFAANGKGAIKVSHLLSHSAGLSGWDEQISAQVIYDWDRTCALLAAQKPWWEPGSAPGYHALTQGYLVGEVIRRASGKTVGTVFREEIAGPLNADFWIGLPASEDARVADLIPPPTGLAAASAPGTIGARTFNNPPMTALEPRTRAWRGAEIPAAGGTGNARAICEAQTVIANLGVSKGKRIMSEAGARRALEHQITGTDVVMNIPAKFGMGYGLPGELIPLPPQACFWGGWGGSLVINDLGSRSCFAYAMNRMGGGTTGDMRGFSLISPTMMALAA